MVKEKEVTIIVERKAPRCFEVTCSDGTHAKTRNFDNANSTYAAHVMLRDYVYDNQDTDIVLHTNANSLIDDIESMKDGNASKRLTIILQETLDKYNSRIVSASYTFKENE